MKRKLPDLNSPKLDIDEQKVVDNIRDHGCHVMWIFDDKGDHPDFSYSIGFPATIGQPEVIVFGLKRELMHSMVNNVREQCAEGLRLIDWKKISGLLDGYDVIARTINDDDAIREHFGWAIWYHSAQRGEQVQQAYQLVWPGAFDGLFPWDAECAENVIALQPALYQTRLNS